MTHEAGHVVQLKDQDNLITHNKLPQGGRCVNNWSLCMDTVATTMSGLSYIMTDGTEQGKADYMMQELELAPQAISQLMERKNLKWLNRIDSYGVQQLQELINYTESIR